MKLDLPASMRTGATLDVFTALEAKGGAGCVRFVGGSVRNLVMGLPVSDFDLSTQLTPEETETALQAAGIRHIPTGKAFGTITAVVGGEAYEITSLRRDVETDGRRAVVSFTTDWAEDAVRRDFYLNALYADISGQIYDPTHQGLEDARNRVVRFIGDPEQRIREDYLRILRFFRFSAAFSDNLDAESLDACVRLKTGIDGLSGERIFQELMKMLSLSRPHLVWQTMLRRGVLNHIFGAVEDGILNGGQLPTLDNMTVLSADPVLRLAALLYDLDHLHGDYLDTVADRLRLPNNVRTRLIRLAINLNDMSLNADGNALKVQLYRLGRDTVLDGICLRSAIENMPNNAYAALSKLINAVEIPIFPVSGRDLMARGLSDGPQLGQALKAIEARWIDNGFSQSVIDLALDEISKPPKISGE